MQDYHGGWIQRRVIVCLRSKPHCCERESCCNVLQNKSFATHTVCVGWGPVGFRWRRKGSRRRKRRGCPHAPSKKDTWQYLNLHSVFGKHVCGQDNSHWPQRRPFTLSLYSSKCFTCLLNLIYLLVILLYYIYSKYLSSTKVLQCIVLHFHVGFCIYF